MSTPESLEDAGRAGPSSSAPCSAMNTEPSAVPIVPSHSRADLALSEDSLAPVFVECLLCDPDCVGGTRGEKDSPHHHQKKKWLNLSLSDLALGDSEARESEHKGKRDWEEESDCWGGRWVRTAFSAEAKGEWSLWVRVRDK